MSKENRKDKPTKRHKTSSYSEIFSKFNADINRVPDLRSKALLIQLYIEYWINEIIVNSFPNPEFIIDDDTIGSFENKLKIVEALDILKSDPKLIKNIRYFQRIRNQYAHYLLGENDVNQKIIDCVKNIEPLWRKSDFIIGKTTEDRLVELGLDTFQYLSLFSLGEINKEKTFTNYGPLSYPRLQSKGNQRLDKKGKE